MMRTLAERWDGHPALSFRDITVFACAFAVLFSVAWSFLNYHRGRRVARGRRSAVDTFSMLLFFVGYSWLIGREVGTVRVPSPALEWVAVLAGVALVVVGGAVNVLGRRQLGPTWANQIAIYEGHELLTGGLFSLVRHPLYASIIWMFLGASLAYLNGAAFLATLAVFVPAMHLRARQEERLLAETFPQYEDYRRRTGEFFPRLSTAKSNRL